MYSYNTPLEECRRDYAGTVLLLYAIAAVSSVCFLAAAALAAHALDWLYVAPLPLLVAAFLHLALRRSLSHREAAEAQDEDKRKREAAG